MQGLKGLAEAIGSDNSLRQTIVSETMAVLKEDSSLGADIAPIDPEALEEDLA